MQKPRRHFLKSVSGVAAAAALPTLSMSASAAILGNSARGAVTSYLPLWTAAWAARFKNVLPNPLSAAFVYQPTAVGTTNYAVTVEQGTANILGLANYPTTIWGYHNQETGPTFPGRTFVVQSGTPITVRWGNGLSAAGQPLPHLLPVDQTIVDPSVTTGVPLAVHHHGGDTAQEFDGGPDQWSTPQRLQTGPGVSTTNPIVTATPNAITAVYDNNQEASMHWYHDHAEGLTGANVTAGLAGLYVVRDANETANSVALRLPAAVHEVPLVIQDRVFDGQGQFNYTTFPIDYPVVGTLNGTFPVGMPMHMPEMFGDVLIVNGKAWPSLAVTPRKWRFRLLNGSDSRFYTLSLSNAFCSMLVVGNDLGLLNNPVAVPAGGLTIAPGERYDVVIDFTNALLGGLVCDLINTAPVPFPAGIAPTAASGTRNVMRFNVAKTLTDAAVPKATTAVATKLRTTVGMPVLPAVPVVPAGAVVRKVLLAEGVDEYGRVTPMLGTYDPLGLKNFGTRSFHDPATETPKLGATEVWEFWNTTVDAHPIHMHLVKFQILSRQAFTGTLVANVMNNGWSGKVLGTATLGAVKAVGAWEKGWKDTVVCPPGQVTRIVVNFNRPGKYVYHCHLLSHEDHDMMRWFVVA